jgi:hypothetical protein
VRIGGEIFAMYTPLAEGEPEEFIESDGLDPVESLIPEIPFPDAP